MFAGTMNKFRAKLTFADCTDATDGVIWKAGFASSAQTAAGIGANGTATGSQLTYTEGGISTSSTNNGSTNKVEITIPSAYQAGLRYQGRVQFDVKSSSVIGVVTANCALWSFRDATNNEQGPRILTNITQGDGYVNTMSYSALVLDVTWAPTINSPDADSQLGVVIDSSLDEWVTLTMSWIGTQMTWLVDGHTVCRSKHAAFTANPTYLRVELIATTLADRIPIRNMILCDHAALDTHRLPGRRHPTVVCIGHSFWVTLGGLPEWNYDSIERTGSLNHLANQTHKIYTETYGPLNFYNLAHDGSVRTSGTVIEGWAAAMTKSNLTFNYADAETIENRVLSGRPDIALLMVHGSDSVAATVNTNMTTILDSLKANLVIPIVVREQNRDAGGTDRTAIDTQVQTTVATWRAANGGDNACGLVDCWTPTGGSTVNTDYVETTGSLIHPSLDVGPIYGGLIAPAIWNAVTNPPSWARWQGFE